MATNPTIEFLLTIFANALGSAYEPKLVVLLQKLHDKNVDLYLTAIHGFNAGIKAVQPLAAETPTQADDGLLAAIAQAVNESAAANGVTLNA